jgi:hypothetical protein
MGGITTTLFQRPRDPDFNQTTLLLSGNFPTNGAQNNTFLDSSSNAFSITRNPTTGPNAPTQGTFSPFSQTGWSNYFDGTSDSLLTPGNTSLVLDGDFTVEFFMYLNTLSISAPISSNQGSFTSGAFAAIVSHGTAPNKLSIWVENINNAAFIISSNSTLSILQWYHVALVRNSGVIRLYLNGVDEGNTSSSATITLNGGTTPRFRIGQYWNGTINGYISNLRVVKGTALYTGAFTPPTSPLTTIANTSLLTCQSNRFVDNSTNAFVMTPSGETSVQAFSPFVPSGAYTTTAVGGSGYFVGADTSLTVAGGNSLAFGTGDFSIEAFVYPTASGSAMKIYDGRNSSTTADCPTLERNASNVLAFSGTTGTIAIPANAWTHVLVSRVSGNLRLFVNGVQDGSTVSDSTNFLNGTARPAIAVRGTSLTNDEFFGYISSLRVLIGSGFTSVTVPTAPPSPAGSSLCLNFTNAGIIDSTTKNVLETVGNAQISTTQWRFGGTSISFDGTGDYLLLPHSVDQFLFNGKFTIEFWLYLGVTGAARGLVAKGTSTTGWLVSLDSSNRVVFTYTTSTITSTGAISGTTWTHIAVVREGTGTNQTKIYINGTNDGTGTVSTSFNQTSVMYVGANRIGGDVLNGYIDDLRITKGVARYTANFNVPTIGFTDR